MKGACLLIILLFSCSYVVSDQDDKLQEAIDNCDPEALRELVIPGYLMSLDAKNKYVKLAQDVTNQTHADLHRYRFSDIGACVKGTAYGCLGLCFANLSIGSLLSNLNFREWKAKLGQFSFEFSHGMGYDALEDNKTFSYCLFALAAYFSYKSFTIFNAILTKHPRLKRHNSALTVEAILQRLPAFDNGCFIPGSLN